MTVQVSIGGVDITSSVPLETIVVKETGCRERGQYESDVNDVAIARTLAAKAPSWVYDTAESRYVFTGFLNPTDLSVLGTGRKIHVLCSDFGELLDQSLVPSELRPAETFYTRMVQLISVYGPLLPQTFTYIEALGALPVTLYENMTLRGAIELTCSLAGTACDYFLDGAGIVHAGTTLLGAAPYKLRGSGSLGGGEIYPAELTISRDPQSIVNAYFVRGKNAAGTGWVTDAGSIATYGRREAYYDAPDADTGPKRDAVGNAALADNALQSLRGSATIMGAHGWRPGQTITIQAAAQFGITSPQSFRLNTVERRYTAGGTIRTYVIQFGGLIPKWSTSVPSPQSWPAQRLAAGSLNLTPFASSVRPVAIVAALPGLPDAAYPLDSYVALSTDHKLYQNVAGTWVNAVNQGLPVGFSGIPSVGSLPGLPSANYPIGFVVFLTTDGKLYRNVANVWTTAVASVDISGLIVASLPTLPNAAYPDGIVVVLTTNHKLYRNNAGTWTSAIAGSDITDGTLDITAFASNVRPVAIVASLPGLPSGTYPMGSCVYCGSDGKLYRNSSNVWTSSTDGGDILAATLTTAAFAAGIRPVAIVGSLPGLPNGTYPTGSCVVLTTDLKLYRNNSGTWTKSADGADILAGTVTASQIAANTITAGQIAAGAIGATQIAANAITAAQIAAATITGTQIAATTIAAGNIAANTITAGQIAAGAIGVSELAALAVTAAKIAAHTITAGQIAAGTITTTEILANTIVAGDIAAATITGNEIAATTITAANIAAATITGNKLVAGTITASQIAAATITGTQVAARTIAASNIVADSITAAEIAAGAINASEIAANAVTASAIAADAVLAEKLSVGDWSNSLTNPDFETGDLTGWSVIVAVAGGTFAYSTGPSGVAAGGVGCGDVRTTGTANEEVLNGSPLPCAPGATLAFAAWMAGTGDLTGAFRVYFYDNAGGYLSAITSAVTLGAAWAHYAGTTTVPASAFYARLGFRNTAASGHLYIDGVTLTRGGVMIDSHGVAITNGAMTVTNPGGTVIIDGTSDLFKIAATGTIATANQAGTPVKKTNTVTLSTGLTFIPATLFFVQSNDGTSNTSELCPNQVISNAGAIAFEYEGWAALSGTNQTRLVVQTFATTAGGGGTTASYRYYVLQEIAF